MPSLIKELWDLFIQKKQQLEVLIKANTEFCIKLLFINQAAEMDNLMAEDDISSIKKLQSVLIDHGYFINRVLEFVDYEELIKIQFEDLPLISEDEITPQKELNELISFIRKIRPYYQEEISIVYLILNLKKKIFKAEIEEGNKIVISSPDRNRDIQKSICISLSNENNIWNSLYSHKELINAEDLIFTLGNSSGIGKVRKSQIIDNWDLFCELWEKNFNSTLTLTKTQFFNIIDNFISRFRNNLPFTLNNLKSKELEDIPNNELSDIFFLADQVLPNIKEKCILENINSITDEYFYNLKKIGIGWKYTTNEQIKNIYVPTNNSIIYFINMVFEDLFKEIDIAGSFYELELSRRISSLNDGIIKLKGNRNYFLGYEPKYINNPEKLSEIYNVNVLEKNLIIKVPGMSALDISEEGEIDLLIYSNNNLFILEAKSFFGKKIQKGFQKASEQCTKYRNWIETDEFNKIIKDKHGIEKFRNIFIFIITNRQENRLYVKCTKSNLFFPVISFAMLPLILLGFYYTEISTKKLIPQHITNALVEIVKSNFPSYSILENFENSEEYRFIWRKYMYIIIHSDSLPEDFDFTQLFQYPFGAGYQVIDHMIEDTVKWELNEHLFLGEAKGYKVFLITELSNMNSKFICHQCKILWIYCYPGFNLEKKPYYEELSNDLCIKCHNKRNEEDSVNEIDLKGIAGVLLLAKKVEIGDKKIGN